MQTLGLAELNGVFSGPLEDNFGCKIACDIVTGTSHMCVQRENCSQGQRDRIEFRMFDSIFFLTKPFAKSYLFIKAK